MISVVQRVLQASVTVESEDYHAHIGPGLCVLLAVERGDADGTADWMANKLANLRVFPDDLQKMNLSVVQTGGDVLVVSQFTLVGNCAKGNRPSFEDAAPPDDGRRLYERVAQQLRTVHGLTVACGVFGGHMQVSLVNDGPVTLIVKK